MLLAGADVSFVSKNDVEISKKFRNNFIAAVIGFAFLWMGEYITSPLIVEKMMGYNSIDIPHMYITRQMMIGNTFRLAKGFYMLSGILYGTQIGVVGNNWGIGNREGFIWHPSDMVAITLWNQYYQSLSVYFPIVYPGTDGAAVRMPATPEVFSFGVQASIVSGRFIIEVGTSVTPKAPKPIKSP